MKFFILISTIILTIQSNAIITCTDSYRMATSNTGDLLKARIVSLRADEAERRARAPRMADDFSSGQIVEFSDGKSFRILEKLGEGEEAAVYLVGGNGGSKFVFKDFFKSMSFKYWDFENGDVTRIKKAFKKLHDIREDGSSRKRVIAKFLKFLDSIERGKSKVRFKTHFTDIEKGIIKGLAVEEGKRLAGEHFESMAPLAVSSKFRAAKIEKVYVQESVFIMEYIDGVSVDRIINDPVLEMTHDIGKKFESLEMDVMTYNMSDPGYQRMIEEGDVQNPFFITDFERRSEVPLFQAPLFVPYENVMFDFNTHELVVIDI